MTMNTQKRWDSTQNQRRQFKHTLTAIQQLICQSDLDSKTGTLQLEQSEGVIERRKVEVSKCEEDIKEIQDKMNTTLDAEER